MRTRVTGRQRPPTIKEADRAGYEFGQLIEGGCPISRRDAHGHPFWEAFMSGFQRALKQQEGR